MSTTSKFLIGLGVVAAGLLALKCGKASKVTQTKKLAEKIKFKPAQTAEEAVTFGKNNLGIKNYEGFAEADKDVLNWVNEGLTNVSNIMCGNTRAFNYIKYDTFTGGYAATLTDGGLMLNRNFFANIDKELSGRLGVLEKQGVLIRNANGQFGVSRFIDENYAKDILKHIERYNKGEFSTFKDKMYLYNYFDEALHVGNIPFISPLKSIKSILNNSDAVQILNSKGILTDITQIEKLSTKEQVSLFVKMIKDGNIAVSFGEGAGKNISPFHAIYHEAGHLYDNVVSGGWLNQTDEQIAGLVSGYAQTSPREFSAETFAKLIAGKKLPDEVLNLYKELGGPTI